MPNAETPRGDPSVRALHIFIEQMKVTAKLAISVIAEPARVTPDLPLLISNLDNPPRDEIAALLVESAQGADSTVPKDLETFGFMLRDRYRGNPAVYAIARECVLAERAPGSSVAMLSMILPSIASSLEALVSALAEILYLREPRLLLEADDSKTVDLADLIAAENLEALITTVVERRVFSLSMGRLGAWKKFFAKHGAVDFEVIAQDWLAVRDLFERRNLVLHNGGVVNRRYLAFCRDNEIQEEAVAGQRLPMSHAYVAAAIGHVYVVGTVIGVGILRRCIGDSAAAEVASGLALDLLQADQSAAALGLLRFAKQFDTDEPSSYVSRVNIWLAELGAGRDKIAVQGEVRSWEADNRLSPLFQLAAACLLEDDDRATCLIEQLLADEQLSANQLSQWPLFTRLRSLGLIDVM